MGMSATGGFSFDRYVVVDCSTGGRNPMIRLHDGELLGKA
jgi:hypothetical protein